MADAPGETESPPPPKRSKKPLLVGVVLTLLLGGGGFYATWSGLMLGDKTETATDEHGKVEPLPDIAFVPLDPLIVSLGGEDSARHLRFTAQVEVAKSHEEEVRLITPRILDVMNTYLRAVEISAIEDPTALIRMRAQILRRLQLVAGEGRIRDVLVTEFVIN
jgi:flagellar FliL protein